MKKVEASKTGHTVVPPRSPASAKKPPSPTQTPFADLVEDDSASLERVIHDSGYQTEIRQWSQANSSDLNKLMARSEVVQWLYQNNRIDTRKWEFLINEIVKGRLSDLLKVKSNLGIVLWNKLCQYLVDNPVELNKCSGKPNLLLGFLKHASLEQRMACFAEADQAMIGGLFEFCGQSGPLRHCLYSVLCHCFARIRNEAFFIKLLNSRAFYLEFAFAASSSGILGEFEREYQDRPWFEQYKQAKSAYFKCKAEIGAEDKIFTENDQARILRYLRSILADTVESKALSDDLLANYFRMNNADICLALFANPILCDRLIQLHANKKIVIDTQDHIFPLMQWMMEKEEESKGSKESKEPIESKELVHFLYSDIMGHYLVAAVELLFAHYNQEGQHRQFLEQFFEYFGTFFFSGVTVEQLTELQNIRGNPQVILGPFAKVCSDKVDAYRVLGDVGEESIYQRWKDTSKVAERFIEEFQYKGPTDVDRWMKLLSCEWKGDLDEKAIIDLIVEHCVQLRFPEFLKDIKGSRSIDQLFSRTTLIAGRPQVYLAKRIVGVKDIFGRCGFNLNDFKSWKPILLIGVLSDPDWHKSYGFYPKEFYRLIREDPEKTLFSVVDKKEGYLDRVLTHPRLSNEDSRRARLFLVRILLDAPADVQRVVQDWLRCRVRKILLNAVNELATVSGIEPHLFAAMMQNQADLSPRRKSLVTLKHYLNNPEIYQNEDFLDVISRDHICRGLVKEILSTAPRCVQDLINKRSTLEVAAAARKPWCAQGTPYKQYPFVEEFKSVQQELQQKNPSLQKADSQTIEAFVALVWEKNCEFIRAKLRDKEFVAKLRKISAGIDKGGEYLQNLLDVKNHAEIWNLLNTNPLARKVGLMFHPHWLEVALIHFSLSKEDVLLHGEFVGTYMQLPEFMPTTRELYPAHLLNNEVNPIMIRLVHYRARQLVEYLIDLCHFDFTKLDCAKQEQRQEIRLRAMNLVDVGIESEFKKLPKDFQDQTEALQKRLDRFLCLCVSASEFLPLDKWDGLFERNETFLSHLSERLAEYDLVTMSVVEIPAFVRLQMILLRNLSKQLVLPARPSESQLRAKHKALESIRDIFWQLSCIPRAALGKIKVRDCLDEASMQRMEGLEVPKHLGHLLTDAVEPTHQKEQQQNFGPK